MASCGLDKLQTWNAGGVRRGLGLAESRIKKMEAYCVSCAFVVISLYARVETNGRSVSV